MIDYRFLNPIKIIDIIYCTFKVFVALFYFIVLQYLITIVVDSDCRAILVYIVVTITHSLFDCKLLY